MRITAHAARLTKTQKFSAAGVAAAAGISAVALAAAPASADNGDANKSLARPAAVKQVNAQVKGSSSLAPTGDQPEVKTGGIVQTVGDAQGSEKHSPILSSSVGDGQVKAIGEQQKQAAADKAEADRKDDGEASRSADRPKKYADNLDGWIKEARSIMKKHGIPGSYEGIHRNIIRESGGNPNVVNDWDVNAQNGIPSKGLLQVIQPTFDSYHVKGTEKDLTDPVANIVAACNYAADRYGSMDNVDSAY